MTPPTLCETLASDLPKLFSCSPHDGMVRIRTPFLYPDGDVIDLFYTGVGEAPVLTDLGETVRWLRMQTVALRRSPKQKRLIEDVCLNHGVEFSTGMIVLRLRPGDRLADALVRLGQACVRVSDVWFTMRTRAVETVTEEVADFLEEKQIAYERHAKVEGRSGRVWDVDFKATVPGRSALIYVLSTGNRAASRRIAEHVVAGWHDLSHLPKREHLKFVSLFDDTLDIWQDEDFRLLEPLSTVMRWSRPDELEAELLRAA